MKPDFKTIAKQQLALNVPLGAAMAIVASICSGTLGITTIPMGLIGMVVAIILGSIIPVGKICGGFCGLFVKNKNPMAYPQVCISVIPMAIIMTVLIEAVMTYIGVCLLGGQPFNPVFIIAYKSAFIPLLITAYISACIFLPWSFKVSGMAKFMGGPQK